MKNFNFQAMLKHGFLIIPKALLQQQIEDRHMHCLLYTSDAADE